MPQSAPRSIEKTYGNCQIRPWQPRDRDSAAELIGTVLKEYGLGWEPDGADQDVVEVETHYWQRGGEFWVVEAAGNLVGTAGYHPIDRGLKAGEIRKMYLCSAGRGQAAAAWRRSCRCR
ncbi:hypothetical protein C7271_05085, partial [filamentous cyanobacterium CCP5]